MEIEEERQLIEDINKGGAAAEQARERLVNEHGPHIGRIAKRYAQRLHGQGVNHDELVSAGWCGYFQALERFEGKNGSRVWNYVKHEAEFKIADEAQTIGAPDWLTEDARAKLGHRRRARQRLIADDNLEPSRADVATEMKVDLGTLDYLDGIAAGVEHLDAPLVIKYDSDHDGDPPPQSHHELISNAQRPAGWSEIAPDPDVDNLPAGLGARELVGRLMDILTDRQHLVIVRAYWQDWSDGRIGREEPRRVTKQQIAKVRGGAQERMKLEAETRGIAPEDRKDRHAPPEIAIRVFARRRVETERSYHRLDDKYDVENFESTRRCSRSSPPTRTASRSTR